MWGRGEVHSKRSGVSVGERKEEEWGGVSVCGGVSVGAAGPSGL